MTYLLLFYEFFKTGLFTIGGGLATLPFLIDISYRYPWYTEAELMNMLAISESTPGPIGINMATYAGYSAGGVPGGLIATAGLVAPSIIIIILIAKFLSKFSDNRFVQDAFTGLRPAVAGLIAAAALLVIKSSILTLELYEATKQLAHLVDLRALALFAVLLLLTNRFQKLHPIVFLGGAAVLGVVFQF